MLGEVLDGRGAARQALERRLQIAHEAGRVNVEMPQDSMQVRVRQVDDLEEPVGQVDVRIAPELTERDGALGRLEHEGVELAEQGCTADLGHWSSSLTPPLAASEAAARAPVPESDRPRRSPPAGHPATSSTPAGLRGRGGYRAPRRGPARAGRPNRIRIRHNCEPSA